MAQLDRCLLSEDLNHHLNADRLRDYTTSLSSLGPIEAFSLSHKETVYRLTTRDYDVIAGGKRLRLHLLLLPTNLVQDVTISWLTEARPGLRVLKVRVFEWSRETPFSEVAA